MGYIIRFIAIRILIGCVLTCIAVVASLSTSDWHILYRWCSLIGLGLPVVGVSPMYSNSGGRSFMAAIWSARAIDDEKKRFNNNVRWAFTANIVGLTMFLAPVLVYVIHPTA